LQGSEKRSIAAAALDIACVLAPAGATEDAKTQATSRTTAAIHRFVFRPNAPHNPARLHLRRSQDIL
jgi:hypothetical protein